MTTFTSDDREDEYKKILAEAPNQPGYEDAVPIPASPPHIVDSGASVMGFNAYKLADRLNRYASFNSAPLLFTKSANMLIEQAEKIADLQTTIKFLEEECKALRGQIKSITDDPLQFMRIKAQEK
jgi:hypothetical protein